MLATFTAHQDRIGAIAEEAERLLRDSGRGAIARIGALRADQGAAMAAYQLFMHREVFAPMIAAASPAEVIAARELKIECITLSNDYSVYVRTLSKGDPVKDWDNFLPAAMQMVARIRSHIATVQAPAAALIAARSDVRAAA